MTTETMQDAFRFFFENDGYIVGERAACALMSARAEAKLRAEVDAGRARVRWEVDDDFDPFHISRVLGADEDSEQHAIDTEIAKQAEKYGAFGCILEMRSPVCEHCGHGGHWEHKASVWGVIGDGDYRRTVEAGLAAEAFDVKLPTRRAA